MTTSKPLVEIHELGCVVHVKASPGSRTNGVTGVHNGALKIAVTQTAERGKANQAIRRVLARAFGLKLSQISLVAGETTRNKRVLIHDTTPKRFLEILQGYTFDR